MGGDREKTLVKKERLHEGQTGWIVFLDGQEIADEAVDEVRVIKKDFLQERKKFFASHVLARQLTGEAGGHGAGKRIAGEKNILEQGGETGFPLAHPEGFLADETPGIFESDGGRAFIDGAGLGAGQGEGVVVSFHW
jgi:hypothetical protein